MSLDIITLRKFTWTCKKSAWKLARTVGKDSGYKNGGLHRSPAFQGAHKSNVPW